MSKTRHTPYEFKRTKGLGQDYQGRIMVAADRNRFGDAYEQSSRMRRTRRAVLHAARLKRKKELTALLEQLENT